MLTRNLCAVVNLLVTHYSLIGDRNHSGSLSSITVQKFHLNIKPFIHGSNAYIITIYDSINDANNAQLIIINNVITKSKLHRTCTHKPYPVRLITGYDVNKNQT